mmetsp:Transcript_10859/g.20208  ORF Transcript_10859/g.20208 Transcript_10859/m.20208 type:complete len:421 (+) Transcript_10859:148-1410(+)
MICSIFSVPALFCCSLLLRWHTVSASSSPLRPRAKTVQLRGKRAGNEKGPGHEWTYADPNWDEDFEACGSAAQSPVDIRFNDVTYGPKEERQQGLLQFMKYKKLEDREVVNHGHNVQVNGLFGDLELPDGTYEVKQFHFHFPSEHAINGQLAAGEMHIVHQRKNATGTEELAVIGVLLQQPWVLGEFNVSKEDHPELSFLDQLKFGTPDLPKEKEELKVNGQVDLSAFAKQFSGPFFHYYGSLTTPPCSRTVHWYVMQTPSIVTNEMIASFKAIFPSPGNNRPLTPLNGRAIRYSVVALPDEYEISTKKFAKAVEEEAQDVAHSGDSPAPGPAPDPEPVEPEPVEPGPAEPEPEPEPSPAAAVPEGFKTEEESTAAEKHEEAEAEKEAEEASLPDEAAPAPAPAAEGEAAEAAEDTVGAA